MSRNRKGWPDRNQSDKALQDFPDDNSMVEADTPIPEECGLEALLLVVQAPAQETGEKYGAGSHAHEHAQHYTAASKILPIHMPATDRSASPPTSNEPPRAHAFLGKSYSLPGIECQHLLFNLVVVLFVVISAAALLAPVLVIVSPKPLRDFAEVAMVKTGDFVKSVEAASNRKRTNHVENQQVVFRGAKLTTIEELASKYAQSARLAAGAEQRRLAALEVQRAFAAERRRNGAERRRLAALHAAAEKAKREETAREQRLTAEAENRRLAALNAQRAFAAEHRREEPARSQHDAKSARAATRKTVTRNELLFRPTMERPVRAVGEVIPQAPSLIIQAGSVLATTQILIGRPIARAQKKLANGFVLTSAIKRQTLKSAWRDIVSQQVTSDPHYRRRARIWFAVAWREASVSHYILALANGNNVASLHIESPLKDRKALSRAERLAVAGIACAASFGDAFLPCARR